MTDQLHIQDQPRLPLAQQGRIVIEGLRHRFTRALLTLLVVTLAIAFVCYVITEQRTIQANLAITQTTLARFDDLNRLLGYLQGPNDPVSFQRRLAQIPDHSPIDDGWDIQLLSDSLKLSKTDTQSLVQNAKSWEAAQSWFEGLPLGHRRVVFGSTLWPPALDRMKSVDAVGAITQGAWDSGARLPKNLLENAQTHSQYQSLLQSSSQKLQAISQAVQARRTEESMLYFLASPTPTHSYPRLQEAGFLLAPDVLAHMQADARQYLNISYLPKASATQPSEDTSASRLRDSLSQANDLRTRIFTRYPSASQPDRTPWLIAVSFLVCLAGITNAMLVSVLERFREIATMKCLGAMDGFIGTIFLAEASLIGILGGVLGALLGTTAGLAKVSWALGLQSLNPVSGASIGIIILQGVLAGWLLTVLSSIYPAFAAARMPPMAAMRVD
jgi:hypothetical protein